MTTSPTDTEIVQQLRAAAKRVFDEGDLDQLTVRRVRQLAESALSLERDYFRNDAQWKLRSKVLIESFGQELLAESGPGEDGEEVTEQPAVSQPVRMFKSTTIRKQPKQASKLNDPDHDTRTKSSKSPRIPSAEPPRKKARSSRVLIDDAQSSASNDADGAGDDPGAASSASDIPAKVTNLRPLETPSGEESIEAERMESSKTKRKRANDKQSRQSTGKPSVIASAKKPKKSDDLSPGEEKVKRLQSQLLKCGIRKLWHKELAKYKTTQAKVSHLETMLADLGIQGRFSEAQAKKIKAKRELQADIQEIQAGAERWGKQDDGDTARASRPGRGLARRSTGTKVEDDEDEGADSE